MGLRGQHGAEPGPKGDIPKSRSGTAGRRAPDPGGVQIGAE